MGFHLDHYFGTSQNEILAIADHQHKTKLHVLGYKSFSYKTIHNAFSFYLAGLFFHVLLQFRLEPQKVSQ